MMVRLRTSLRAGIGRINQELSGAQMAIPPYPKVSHLIPLTLNTGSVLRPPSSLAPRASTSHSLVRI